MTRLILALKARQQGATAIEYALIVGLIAVAIVLVVTTLGGRLDQTFQAIMDALPGS